jgi:hypothetical protein
MLRNLIYNNVVGMPVYLLEPFLYQLDRKLQMCVDWEESMAGHPLNECCRTSNFSHTKTEPQQL